MDALTSQLASLEPAERWALLARLARTNPREVQQALAAIRRVRHQDIPVTGWRINGIDYPEPGPLIAENVA